MGRLKTGVTADTGWKARATIYKETIMVASIQPVSPPRRSFVPVELDAGDFKQIRPLFEELLKRPINSAAELEKWLGDASELYSVIDEYGSRRYIAKSCHTEDPAIEK